MSKRAVQLRLRQRGHVLHEWASHLDEKDAKAMRRELEDAIAGAGGDPDDDRHRFQMEYRDFMGSWRTFGAGS